MRILDLELSILRNNLQEIGGYDLKVSKAAKDILIAQGYNEKYGARQMNRTIESMIENRVSEMVLRGQLKEGATINVRAKEGELYLTTS